MLDTQSGVLHVVGTDGKGTYYQTGDSVDLSNGSLVLYAIWRKDVYQIRYVLNKGRIAANDSPANIKKALGVEFFSDAYFRLVEGGETL